MRGDITLEVIAPEHGEEGPVLAVAESIFPGSRGIDQYQIGLPEKVGDIALERGMLVRATGEVDALNGAVVMPRNLRLVGDVEGHELNAVSRADIVPRDWG